MRKPKGVARRREQRQITLTNCREKAIFAAPLSGRQAMKQFIVINTGAANSAELGVGVSGSPSQLWLSVPIHCPFQESRGAPWREVIGRFSAGLV